MSASALEGMHSGILYRGKEDDKRKGGGVGGVEQKEPDSGFKEGKSSQTPENMPTGSQSI